MAVFTPTPNVVAWQWGTSGEPKIRRRIQTQQAWVWGTGGQPKRIITVPPQSVGWQWSTTGGSQELARQELLVGSGVKLKVYDPNDPNELLAIVQFESLEFEDGLSGVTGAKFVVAASRLDLAWVARDMIWRVDVEGIERFGFLMEDDENYTVSRDGKYVTVTGKSTAKVLEWATVAPANFGLSGESVKRRFQKPRAAILKDLIDEAQARGAIPLVVRDGWNENYDSKGAVWTDVPELEFEAGSNLLEKITEWGDLGFEWHMGSRFELTLAAEFGRDLSSIVRLYPAQSVQEQVTTRSFAELRTALFVQDGNDGVSLLNDLPAQAAHGVREQYAVFGDTVAEGDRTANGYALLNLLKDPVVERRVTVDPFATGRRPFVDFGLGDTVSVMFNGQPEAFRVLAIAFRAVRGREVQCEVTLEYMLEAARRRRRRLLNADGGGGGVATGQSTVFGETQGPVTIGSLPTDICVVTLQSFVSTYGKLGWLLNGTASTAQLLTVEVVYGSTVIKTFYHQVPRAGQETAEITWFWPAIPTGMTSLLLRVRTDTGTFSLAAPGDGQLWVEAKGIQGSLTASTEIFANDDVEGGRSEIADLYDIGESTEFSDLETDERPVAADAPELDLYSVVDSVGPAFVFGFSQEVVLPAEDGVVTSVPSFTSAGTKTIVGDVAGVKHGAFYRFDLLSAHDLTGCTITEAYLIGVSDATVSVPATTFLYFADEANPAAVSSHADFWARPRLPTPQSWNGTSVAGTTYQSPNLKNQIQALVDNHGDLEAVLVLHQDSTSAPNGRWEFRSQEHPSSPAMVLLIRFTYP